jgi:hypothetical protein
MRVDVFSPCVVIGVDADLSLRIRLMTGRSTKWTAEAARHRELGVHSG